jgi:hypothetical protein
MKITPFGPADFAAANKEQRQSKGLFGNGLKGELRE